MQLDWGGGYFDSLIVRKKVFSHKSCLKNEKYFFKFLPTITMALCVEWNGNIYDFGKIFIDHEGKKYKVVLSVQSPDPRATCTYMVTGVVDTDIEELVLNLRSAIESMDVIEMKVIMISTLPLNQPRGG